MGCVELDQVFDRLTFFGGKRFVQLCPVIIPDMEFALIDPVEVREHLLPVEMIDFALKQADFLFERRDLAFQILLQLH